MPASSSDTAPTHRPRRAARIKPSSWKRATVACEVVGVKGGFSNKALAANTIDVHGQRYIELQKNAEWFMKAVGGMTIQKGELKAVTVCDDIRNKFCQSVGETMTLADEEPDAAVAESAEPAVAESAEPAGAESADPDAPVDPMDGLRHQAD